MLIQALRLHLAKGPRGGVGWLFALADKEMSAAIDPCTMIRRGVGRYRSSRTASVFRGPELVKPWYRTLV